jgi:hypothetical protein
MRIEIGYPLTSIGIRLRVGNICCLLFPPQAIDRRRITCGAPARNSGKNMVWSEQRPVSRSRRWQHMTVRIYKQGRGAFSLS